MRKILLGFAACALIMTSCSKNEVSESLGQNDNKLNFSMHTGTQSRAFEVMTPYLEAWAVEGSEIQLYAYESALGTFADMAGWYSSPLWNAGGVGTASWQINSIRFANAYATKYFTIWPKTTGVLTDNTTVDANGIPSGFPTFGYVVQGADNDDATMEDLMGGSDGVVANSKNVNIKMRHLLSQINFGVYGNTAAQVRITGISISNVKSTGTYTFTGKTSYPVGEWTDQDDEIDYTYNPSGGLTNDDDWTVSSSVTMPTKIESTGNKFIYGDGGNWGPSNATTNSTTFYWEPNAGNTGWKIANTFVGTTKTLSNSLMLMPQDFTTTGASIVTITFNLVSWDGQPIVTGGTGTFDLAAITPYTWDATLNSGAGGKTTTPGWSQNFRYVYMIDFSDYLKDKQLVFSVSVDATPWQNYDSGVIPGDGDVRPGYGIITDIPVGSDELAAALKADVEGADVTSTFTYYSDASAIDPNDYTMTAASPEVITIVFNGVVPTATASGSWLVSTTTNANDTWTYTAP